MSANNKLQILLLALVFIYISNDIYAQTGINTQTPQACLDVRDPNPSSPSSGAGIAVPQVSNLPTTGNRAGQILYYTAENRFYYYDGTSWKCLDCKAFNGDVKHSFTTDDHGGWVLLDGRAISSLPTNQQAQATALGFSGNLPDANDRVLKKKGTVGTTGGSNSVTLTQANLPDVDFTGTTSNDGRHRHGFQDGGGHSHSYNAGSDSPPNLARGNSSDHTSFDGEHFHTVSVSSGGSGTAINVENSYLSVNTFIYLGVPN